VVRVDSRRTEFDVPTVAVRKDGSYVGGWWNYAGIAILSILKDFHVKPGYDGGNPKPDPPVSHMGLVDLVGAPKPAFATVKRLLLPERRCRERMTVRAL
jgi:hypothetical protein